MAYGENESVENINRRGMKMAKAIAEKLASALAAWRQPSWRQRHQAASARIMAPSAKNGVK
jgi:hypothetical protein